MVFVTAELYENAGVDVIKDNENYFWVKIKVVQDGLGIKNMRDAVRKQMQSIFETKKLNEEQNRKYVRPKNEIDKKLKNDLPHYKYARNDIMEKIIKNCSRVKSSNDGVKRQDKEKQRHNFRELLGFKENQIFETKVYSIIKRVKKVFIRQKIIEQYRVERYFIDLYFPEHKLGIEVDENVHLDRSKIKEQEREETIKTLGITLIRINPDKDGFDIFDEISEIQNFIYESGIKIGKKLEKSKIIEDLERSVGLIKMSR